MFSILFHSNPPCVGHYADLLFWEHSVFNVTVVSEFSLLNIVWALSKPTHRIRNFRLLICLPITDSKVGTL